MAANRENQGLQVALILFVMITILLAVTTFVYYRKSEEKITEAKQALDEARSKRAVAETLQNENNDLKSLMGYPSEEKWDAIKTNFDKDMLSFGQGFGDDNRNYRTLPDFLIGEIIKQQVQITDLTAREKSLLAAKDQDLTQEKSRATLAESKLSEAVTDLTDERNKFNQDRNTKNSQMTEIQGQLTAARQEGVAEIEKKNREIATLASQLSKQAQLVTTLTEQKIANSPKTTFETPDGRVTWVSPGRNMVYINLGNADGLTRQTTFAVFDINASNVAMEDAKGSIEITTVLGPHLAEARIIKDDLADPILTGDQVFSPAWRPGSKVHFALAGFMDTNGDGISDRNTIRNVITMNGGIVDAEVADDGARTGKLSINTRYLVMGDRPTEKTSAEGLRAYTNLLQEAGELGIEKISVDKLLASMGWQGSERTINVGRARPEDLKPANEAGVGGGFRPRRPPERGANGAF